MYVRVFVSTKSINIFLYTDLLMYCYSIQFNLFLLFGIRSYIMKCQIVCKFLRLFHSVEKCDSSEMSNSSGIDRWPLSIWREKRRNAILFLKINKKCSWWLLIKWISLIWHFRWVEFSNIDDFSGFSSSNRFPSNNKIKAISLQIIEFMNDWRRLLTLECFFFSFQMKTLFSCLFNSQLYW